MNTAQCSRGFLNHFAGFVQQIAPGIRGEKLRQFSNMSAQRIVRQELKVFEFSLAHKAYREFTNSLIVGALLGLSQSVDLKHVPYRGSVPGLVDVMGGQIDLAIGSFTTFYPHAQSGKLNAIAMTGKSRSAFAPAVASFGEGVPGYEALGWFGFFTRKGSPPATITAFNTAVNTALAKPDIAQKTLALGLDTVAGTPAQFGAIWMNDYDKWGKLLRTLKLEAK
jgi:tripartite-type tricarboxylate transporter receptor subunit TctC